jgi:hypothetical protein
MLNPDTVCSGSKKLDGSDDPLEDLMPGFEGEDAVDRTFRQGNL